MVKIYSTLSKKTETLKPRAGKTVKLFVCGITPYDNAHLGHARTYVVFDAFAKFLKSAGFKVFYLQNVTDVDDKIIQRANDSQKSWREISRNFEKEYLKEMKALGVTSVSKYARATDHIKEIISQVERLLKKGYAYEIAGDGIYYDISKFKDYGKLAHRTKEQAQDAVSRIDESVHKRNKGDFALWKLAPRSPEGEVGVAPSWKAPFGLGRPGWHIEDTAIAEKYFGPQYDVHGGGIDLLFPHHESEIAQMEAISGKKPMAKYWVHAGFLTMNGEKMSKSLGNFVTINDFLKTHSPRLLGFFVLKSHYRSPVDYSNALLAQAERELERIDNFVENLRETRNVKPKTQKRLTLYASRFKKALEDDFNTPEAVAVLFELMKEKTNPKGTLQFLKEADKILGFIFSKEKKEKIPPEIKKLVEMRETYRQEKNWQKADEMRNQINSLGWQIEDTPQGAMPKRIKNGE